jgi:hypothetical protein
MSKVISIMLLVALGAFVVASSSHAYWLQDGVALCTAAGSQSMPKAVSDGVAGAIVAWQDNRSGNYDIYVRRVNVSGTPQWAAGGVALCTATGAQEYPAIVSDGLGGAIVVWQDLRSGAGYDIYAQRVDNSGNPLWTANGVVLSAATGNQQSPQIISDGFGGAIVAWYDYRGGNWDIYAQRISVSGTPVWTADGVAICTATNSQTAPRIESDGSSGAIVVWQDYRSGTGYDIYAQRVNYGGTALWTANGVALCAAAGNQTSAAIVSDGLGGAIVAWEDTRSGADSYVYAQRVNSSGTAQWAANGVALCPDTADQSNPGIVSDGNNGAIVAWMDYRALAWDVYAQRIDKTGAIRWGSSGLAVCTATLDQENIEMISDGVDGAIIAWQDERATATSYDIYAQRVSLSGVVQWAADGVAVIALIGNQAMVTMASDETGGAIFAWYDNRTLDLDIYAKWMEGDGSLGTIEPEIHAVDDVPGDQGGKVYVSWGAIRSDVFMDADFSHYSIWRAIDPAAAAKALDAGALSIESLSDLRAASGKPVVRIERAAGLTYYWELVETVDALHTEGYGKPVATLFDSTAVCADYHYFEVVAHTIDPMVYWASEVDSGYSVDNLSPCPPVYLAGEQLYSPEGLNLTWNRNTAADLDGYRVYRGLTEDFVPSVRNLLGAPCDTIYFDTEWSWDGGYYYKVSAIDVHGNESGFALLRPEEITGAEMPKAPLASYVAQNYPNPFNPATRIVFGLSEPANISLRIYDAAGRLVRTLAEGSRPAGHYTETWDGRDMRGSAMASGVYFYRIVAGSFAQTKKMILLR